MRDEELINKINKDLSSPPKLAENKDDAKKTAEEADRVLAVGTANAQATKLAVDAYGGPEYRLAEQNFAKFAEAQTRINQPLVPQFLMSGGQGQEGSSAGSSTLLNHASNN